MDPRRHDCLGLYLYGAGYFARDDNTLGIVTGRGSSQPHFCLACPQRAECETEHKRRVADALPEEVEQFERLLREGCDKGFEPTLATLALGQRGLDPFAKVAIDNFGRGHADRGRRDGALVR